ncbi:WW domain-binding protein 2-like [Watersipora subatra]|uniref:WW domain-binding protein 2-like n=1 Tax=Watersipora subatra TaxID=2589382 RepID=UPI00355BFD73
MSLNTAHAFNGAGVVLYNGERILLFTEDVRLALSNSSVPAFKGEKKGKIYLTSHRIIFMNTDQRNALQSFSIPFTCMRDVGLEQPVFGSNHIKGKVVAEPHGNWVGTAKFQLYFYSGGAIDFGQAMMKAGQLALKNRAPPAAAPQISQQNIFQAPPPAYGLVCGDPNYGWLPYSAFPSAPPASGVYMTDAPPPYPGMMPAPPMYTPPGTAGSQQMPTAYYDPNQPNTVYAAATAPPEYDEDLYSKKRV